MRCDLQSCPNIPAVLSTATTQATTHSVITLASLAALAEVWHVIQGLRGALNAVLFRTGDQSRDFAVVLATNRPGDLDSAILDRMDEALEFGLPGVSERQQILTLYLDQYIFKAGTVEGGAGAASSRGLWQRFSVQCPSALHAVQAVPAVHAVYAAHWHRSNAPWECIVCSPDFSFCCVLLQLWITRLPVW